MYDKTIIVHVYFIHRVLPPLKKCVKKINACNVKKENLFDPEFSFVSFLCQKTTKTFSGELFSFSVMQ